MSLSDDSQSLHHATAFRPSCGLLPEQLPDELWLMVWTSLSQDDRLKITTISRAWRSLAVGNPRLWSQLDIWTTMHADRCTCDICTEWPDQPAHNLKVVSMLLKRSKDVGLEVTITTYWHEHYVPYDPPVDKEDDDRLEAVLHVLGPELHRIKLLRFEVDEPRHVRMFFWKVDLGALSQLHSIEMECTGDADQLEELDPYEEILEEEETLSALNLRCVWGEGPRFLWPESWSKTETMAATLCHLHALSIGVTSLEDLSVILVICTQLTKLRLNFHCFRFPDKSGLEESEQTSPLDVSLGAGQFEALVGLELDCVNEKLDPGTDSKPKHNHDDHHTIEARTWAVLTSIARRARTLRLDYSGKRYVMPNCGLAVLRAYTGEQDLFMEVKKSPAEAWDGRRDECVTILIRSELVARSVNTERVPSFGLTFYPRELDKVLEQMWTYVEKQRFKDLRLNLEHMSTRVGDKVLEEFQAQMRHANVSVVGRAQV